MRDASPGRTSTRSWGLASCAIWRSFAMGYLSRYLPFSGFEPTADTLYVHGSVASRSLVDSPGQTVCVSVTHIDGLVLARSLFEHSVNYRSALVFGVPRLVAEPDELLRGLRVVSEQAAPGQWDYARRPSRKELAATTLLALGVDEASVKLSIGHPDDGAGPDGDLPVWAGRLPLEHLWGTPEPDPVLRDGIPAPGHVAARTGTRADQPG
ncbi:MAG TPA: pyridoxamine 5'-phosphate oxidase family protein [Nocardioidaceae bacterium]|nr:pyridoxamine 5'-phosphate oxidase family protein [Nocardioidaceae bacterium]